MSVSVTVAVPDASDVSSVAEVTAVLVIVGASFRPLIVMVTVWLVPSELVTAKVSVMVAEAARACTALFESVSVYAHAPEVAIV